MICSLKSISVRNEKIILTWHSLLEIYYFYQILSLSFQKTSYNIKLCLIHDRYFHFWNWMFAYRLLVTEEIIHHWLLWGLFIEDWTQVCRYFESYLFDFSFLYVLFRLLQTEMRRTMLSESLFRERASSSGIWLLK